MSKFGVNYDVAWNGSGFVVVVYGTTAAGSTVEFAESFAVGGEVFEGVMSSSLGISAAASGKIGIGGSVSTSAGSASLSNSGAEGKQGPMSSGVEDLIQALYGGSGVQGDATLIISQVGYVGTGNSGNIGTTSLTLESLLSAVEGALGSSGALSAGTGVDLVAEGQQGAQGHVALSTQGANVDLMGQEGIQGDITTAVSISAALFGSFGDEQIVFEGSLGATLSEFESEITGGAGVGGAISTQIITMASKLSAIIGSSGSYTVSLDNLASYIDGLTGVSGQISASISSGADLAGKIGISGEIVTSLDHLSLQLIEIVMSDRIYQIVFSTKTGQAVFLAPKFGTIEMTTET